MFWTSIKVKLRHLSRIILTYVAYESNLSVILTKLEFLFFIVLFLLLSIFV